VVQVFHDVPMDREVWIREGAETWVSRAAEPFPFPDSNDTAR
jgi:hypothetical protein